MAQDNVLGIQATVNGKDIQQGADEFIRQVGRMEAAADSFTSDLASKSRMVNGQVESIGVSFDSVVKTITKGAAALGVAFSAQQFVTQVAKTRGEFQQLEVAFTTMLDSAEKANALMSQLTTTAAVTPFGLQEVASGAKSLLAYGVASEKVNDTLVRLGDIASGLSIPLNDLVYLYGTTMTQGKMFTQDLRQFQGRGIPLADELAKQFGVTKDRVGELVTAGKVGFAELEKAIISMTSEGGKFGGLMEAQSKTIIGQWSNIQDAIDGMFNEIGKSQEGVINTALEGVSLLVENYEKVGEVIGVVVTAYGVYKASIMTAAALYQFESKILRQAVVEKTLAAKAGIQLSNAQAVAAARTKMFTIAQQGLLATLKAINAATLANPYVMLAAAITAVLYATYKVASSTSIVDKAQERLGASISNVEKATTSEISKLNALQKQLKEAKEGSEEYNNIKKTIIDNYGKYYDGLDKEIEKVGDLSTVYDGLTESIRKSIGQRQFKSFFDAEQSNLDKVIGAKIDKAYETLVDKYGQTEGVNLYSHFYESVMNGATLTTDAIKKLKDATFFSVTWGDDAQDGIVDFTNDVYNLRSEIEQTKKASDDAVDAFKKKYRIDENTAASLLSGNEGGAEEKPDESYQKAYKEAEKAWRDKGKALEAAKKKTKDDYLKAKSEYEEAEKAFKDLGGDTSRKKQEQDEDNTIKAKKELAKKLFQIANDNIKNELLLESDATKQRLRQIELEFNERKVKINEEAKELAEANKKAGILDVNGNGLTNEQQQQINKANMLNASLMDKSIKEMYQAPLDEYQSYTDKRLEIEKKFNNDIKILKEAREKYEKEGNVEATDRINRALNEAIAQKGKELMSHDLGVLKSSPEYIKAFEDLGNTSTETLESLLEQFEAVKEAAAESLSPENLREYTETIKELTDEIEKRNPFKALIEAQKEVEVTTKNLIEAQNKLNKVQTGEKVVKSVVFDEKTGKFIKEYWTLEEVLEVVRKAKDENTTASNKLKKAENEVANVIDTLGDSLKNIGNTIGGTAGECISLMGDIASFTQMCIIGTSQVSETSSKALQAIEKASIILNIISTAISLLQRINSDSAFKQYDAYAEKLKEISDLTAAVREYKVAVMEAEHAENSWFSENNLKDLREYKKINDEIYNSYFESLNAEQAKYKDKGNGAWLFKSGGINYFKENVKALHNLRIETKKASSGFLGTGIGGNSQKTQDLIEWAREQGLGELFDNKGMINDELANIIIDKYGDRLVGQTKETLETLLKLKEEYDEYMQTLREYVNSLYEPLVDNFVDSLWDWFEKGEDALDNFKNYAANTFKDIVSDMMKTIVLEKVVGSFGDDISKLYEEYAKGTLSETELIKQVSERTSSLVQSYEQSLPELQNIMSIVGDYLNAAGIDLKDASSYSQEASKRGFGTEMTHEDAGELSGRFTALQIVGEEVKIQSQQQTALQTIISTDVSEIRQSVATQTQYISEIVDIQYESVGYLAEISKNTKQLYEMNERLGKIEENTRNI